MKAVRRSLILPPLVVAAMSLAVSGCDSAESRVQAAFAEYEAAKAQGDLNAARIALLKLVSADDSDARYWTELGRLQLQMGAYNDAYYALQRAYELDRSNVEVAAGLTQLALLSGNTDAAEQRAQELELLAPDHPAIKLTYGYVALRRDRPEEANRYADEILAASPFEPQGKLLKARIMVAEQRHEEAVKYLQDHVRVATDDVGSLQALSSLLRALRRWPELVEVSKLALQASPSSLDAALQLIESALRSGQIELARSTSLKILRPDAPGASIDRVLSLWAELWRSPEAVAEARKLLPQLGAAHPLALATYFNRAGAPETAAELLGGAPQRPVTKANASLNSLLAESMALRGAANEAKPLLDEVIRVEPDHVHALRTRTELFIRTGAAPAAVRDAQRLVSIRPKSAEERLLLARAYAAAGDARQVDRTLWAAFHEIPGNSRLFTALRAHAGRTGGQAEVARVEQEFRAQNDDRLLRDLG
jgi:predicted Zn-dependent protease